MQYVTFILNSLEADNYIHKSKPVIGSVIVLSINTSNTITPSHLLVPRGRGQNTGAYQGDNLLKNETKVNNSKIGNFVLTSTAITMKLIFLTTFRNFIDSLIRILMHSSKYTFKVDLVKFSSS